MKDSKASRFAQALHAYGLARCSFVGSTICVGLGPDPAYRRSPLETVPGAPEAVAFLAAPQQADLIAAFTASQEACTVNRLMIGTSHNYAVERAGHYDMSDAVAALSEAALDSLTHLSLGDMELLFNGHRLLGTLGEITHLFAIAPRLCELDLYGHFNFGQPVRHDQLQDVSIALDDIGFSGGPLSQASVSNLLTSSFPNLATFHLDLDEGDRLDDYTIPDAFFDDAAFPALTAFSMDCLTDQSAARLSEWKQANRIR